MRGTPIETNTALSAPILVMGAERSLFILSCLFWGWAFMGVFPHWPVLMVILGFIITVYLLRFAAKRDSQAVAVFKANSRFILQKRFYMARGYAATIHETRKIYTIPVNKLTRF